MIFGLPDKTVDQIKGVLKKYPNLNKVIIYGSRAMGNYRQGSDIDLALSGNNLNLTIMNKIANDIDDLMLPYFVDISIYEKISNPDLIDHIKRRGRIFYCK